MIVRKFPYIVPMALFVLAAAVPVYAGSVSGCTDSPEIPTVALGLIVSAASIGFHQVRNRIGNRRKP
jgi:XrtJ-associated TM-motif-TM protein